MKKWFAFVAIFVSSYVVFLMSSLPLTFVVNQVKLPSSVKLGVVTGSVWDGKISQLTVNNNDIKKVETSLSFWSLFTLSPSVDINFGDAMIAGPEGELTLEVSSDELSISDAKVLISAADVAKVLPLPIPVAASGDMEINISQLTLVTGNKLECLQGDAEAIWTRARVEALDKNVKLGKLSVDVNCKEGDIFAKVNPKNDLGLTFDALLTLPEKKTSGQGYLKPGAKFPSEVKPVLSFLGRADKEGRYTLKF